MARRERRRPCPTCGGSGCRACAGRGRLGWSRWREDDGRAVDPVVRALARVAYRAGAAFVDAVAEAGDRVVAAAERLDRAIEAVAVLAWGREAVGAVFEAEAADRAAARAARGRR